MSHPNQPPGSAAAQYAGYASFYGTPQGHAPPRPQGFAPMAVRSSSFLSVKIQTR